MSYFDLFQFISKRMQIKLENWEESALESRLDRLSMAFIEFNEFNEFTSYYGVKWGEPLLLTDLEDILEAKINLSFKDYKVCEHDYFEGCPTMLTSEKAALSKVREIFKKLKREKIHEYLDPDFGPKDKNDDEGHSNSIYINGKLP
jgi:hypothetical protein